MSAPPHDGWPAEGSRWEYWDDLLLASQLAGLREGWTGISKGWDDRQPEKLLIRCHVGCNAMSKITCLKPLLIATPSDRRDLSGAWIVSEVQRVNLVANNHSEHGGAIGISDAVKSPPPKRPKIKLKQIVKGWNELHLIEASLRVEGRKSNRFIKHYTRVNALYTTHYTQYFGCVLGERCTFFIRFRPVPDSDTTSGGPEWKCTDLCRSHSCSSYDNSPPSAFLQKCLDFWPLPKYSRSHHDTVRDIDGRGEEHSTKTDDHLGPYRLLAAGETFEMKFPEPEPELVEEFEVMKVSRSKIKLSLKTIETTLRHLRTELALAEILDDTDEVKRLKAEISNSLEEKEVVTAKLEEEEREMAEVEIQVRVKKSGKRELDQTAQVQNDGEKKKTKK